MLYILNKNLIKKLRDLKGKTSLYIMIIYPEPTPIRISTMTATSSIGASICLRKLYEEIKLDDVIIGIQYSDLPPKGYSKKKKKKVNTTKKRKCFYNQLTLIYQLSNDKKVNQKIFLNGKIQMTGLRSERDGIYCINKLISKLNENRNNGVVEGNIEHNDLNIALINSDFDVKFRIKRERLFEILVNEYNIYVTYEPDIYPGVNSKYYWNNSCKNPLYEGVCCCTNKCLGKGRGNGNGDCKKITISIFQSGKIIITGAISLEQIDSAYNFINKVIKDNFHEVRRKKIIPKKNKPVSINLDKSILDMLSTVKL